MHVPLPENWIQRNNKYLAIHELVQHNLSLKYCKPFTELCKALLASFVLTGCDTVSFLFGRGKRKAATVALQIAGNIPHLTNFGDKNFNVTVDVIVHDRSFIGTLYGKPSVIPLDILHEHIFANNKGDIRKLPPTKNSFHFHQLRSLYQLAFFEQAAENSMTPGCRTIWACCRQQ